MLRQFHRLYSRKAKTLDSSAKTNLETLLQNLQTAIIQKQAAQAEQIADEFARSSEKLMPRSPWDRARDFTGAILFALAIAVLIRTMWFEPYTIPSGSMRPTLKEEDYLVVSKTDYGINVPLRPAHFYFDSSLVQRGSIIVFNSANIDVADSDTTYFYLFPGKKQFVKRLIGKPGDILYFYGGQIYGIDAEGKEITDLRDPKWFQDLEHIPMIRFDGKVETPNSPQGGVYSPVIFNQMNQPVAKMSVTAAGTIHGEMITQKNRPPVAKYSDLWGMKHYAMSRLLTKAQMEQIHPKALKDLEEGVLYLELTHHPSLQGALFLRDEYNRFRPELGLSTSFIPLQQKHLEAIADHMVTCRFTVKNGKAWRLGWNPKEMMAYLPSMPDVPDGTYEIQDGKVYRLPFPNIPIVGLFTNGVTREVPADHPLYKKDPQRIQMLFNLGMEFLNQYNPTSARSIFSPSRYTYFRGENLYLFGAPVVKKDDPTLIDFHKREHQKQLISTTVNPYFPFKDQGPPSIEEIRKNGIQVPEKMYLALGDNHAMSADSRQFGFVPEDNLKGGVSFLFSPPGPRWGRAPQPEIPHATVPNVTIWVAFILIASGTSFYYRRKFFSKPLKF